VEKIMAENTNLAQLKGYGVTIPVRIDLRAESGEAAIGDAVAAVQCALKSNQYDFNMDGDQAEIVYIDYTTPHSETVRQPAAAKSRLTAETPTGRRGGWFSPPDDGGQSIFLRSTTMTKTKAAAKKASPKAKAAKPAKPAKKPEPRKNGKLSAIDAAAKVLGESKEPMNTRGMIEAMSKKGYWTSASSKYDFGIEVFQFPTCVVDLELPIDASLLGVAGLVPGGRFLAESGHVA
jgi:hypothetical protein